MSTLSLAKSGYVSSSKRTKHIKAKYFFVRHFQKTGEINLQYCPTELMWSDVLTKPIQGAKFRLMRAFLMNCPLNYAEESEHIQIPTVAPTLNSTKQPMPQQIPSSKLTDNPMKPRFLQPDPSSRGCVETKSHGTNVPSPNRTPILKKYGPTKKSISWRDTLFPRHLAQTHPSPTSDLHRD